MITAEIKGLDKLQKELRALSRKAKAGAREDVIVGFTQSYAIWVHEIQARHKPGKQWKYLESPARRLATTGELIRLIKTVYEKTNSLTSGMTLAGLRIQREAQEIVPIDTGALRASAFTAKESNVEANARRAFAESEYKRIAGEFKKKNRK